MRLPAHGEQMQNDSPILKSMPLGNRCRIGTTRKRIASLNLTESAAARGKTRAATFAARGAATFASVGFAARGAAPCESPSTTSS